MGLEAMRDAVRKRPKEPLIFAENDPADPKPKIIVDIKLGETMRSLDVDVAGIVARMESEGIPDEVIASAIVHFAASRYDDDSEQFSLVAGEYCLDTNTITLHPQDTRRWLNIRNNAMRTKIPGQHQGQKTGVSDDEVSENVNRNLYHEIRHMAQKSTPREEFLNKQYRNRQIGKAVLAFAGIFSGSMMPHEAIINSVQHGDNFVNIAYISIVTLIAGSIVKAIGCKQPSQEPYQRQPAEIDANRAERDATRPLLVSFEAR